MAKVTFFVSDDWYTVGNIAEWGDQVVTLSPGTHTLEISGELIVRAIFRDNFVQSARWTYYELLPIQNLPDGTTIIPGRLPVNTTGQSFRISINEGYEYEIYGGAGSPQSTTTTLYLDFAQYNICSYKASASGAFEKLTVRAPSDIPSKSGYVFLGWSDVQRIRHGLAPSLGVNPETGETIVIPPYDPILDATEVVYRPRDEIPADRIVPAAPNSLNDIYPHVGAVFAPRGNLRTYIAHNGEMRPVTPFIVKDGKWTVCRSALGLQGIFEVTKSVISSAILGKGRLGFMVLGADPGLPRLNRPTVYLETVLTPQLSAPVITLKTDQLSAPVIVLETEQLSAPIITIEEE